MIWTTTKASTGENRNPGEDFRRPAGGHREDVLDSGLSDTKTHLIRFSSITKRSRCCTCFQHSYIWGSLDAVIEMQSPLLYLSSVSSVLALFSRRQSGAELPGVKVVD